MSRTITLIAAVGAALTVAGSLLLSEASETATAGAKRPT